MFEMSDWFKRAFGFTEPTDYQEAQERLLEKYDPEENTLNTMSLGAWRFSSLGELRKEALTRLQTASLPQGQAECSIAHVVGESFSLHRRNPGCTFQAASQFNCLEFASPNAIPEDGVTGYMYDQTQGPACARACPPATAFRNYLVEWEDGGMKMRGQTTRRQLNGVESLHSALSGMAGCDLWRVHNGYLDASDGQLRILNKTLANLTEKERDSLKDKIRVGAHFGTSCGFSGQNELLVGQVFAAAPAVGYSRSTSALFEGICRLILESEYESTLWATLLNHHTTPGNKPEVPTVFLTKLGGGVFANSPEWIAGSLQQAVQRFQSQCGRQVSVDIRLVHFGNIECVYEVLIPSRPKAPVSLPDNTLAKDEKKKKRSLSGPKQADTTDKKRPKRHNVWEGFSRESSDGILPLDMMTADSPFIPAKRPAKKGAKKNTSS